MELEHIATRDLDGGITDGATRDELLALCRDAYEGDVAGYLADAGPGTHLLGRVNSVLVSHAMIVERRLQQGEHVLLRTAYVELVATHPSVQRRGYASALLQALTKHMTDFDLAALSPSEESFYARLGWESWRGRLAARKGDAMDPTPDEEVMILRLPKTPVWLDVREPLSVEWRPGEVW